MEQAQLKDDVSDWYMFNVIMTNNNNQQVTYTSSMIGNDEDKAKELAMRYDWQYGIKSIDSVVFRACQ